MKNKMELQTDPINIIDYIAHLKAGGSYTPSREASMLGPAAMNHENQARATLAMKHGRALEKKRLGNSKYLPADCERKRLGRA